MKLRERAYVKDEGTTDTRYFIEVSREHGGTVSGSLRFSHRDNADRIAAAINKTYEREGRLWNGDACDGTCEVHCG